MLGHVVFNLARHKSKKSKSLGFIHYLIIKGVYGWVHEL
jgi:hypothetical protein